MTSLGIFRGVLRQVAVPIEGQNVAVPRLTYPLVALTLVSLATAPTTAEPMTYNVSFSASDLQIGSGRDPPPVNPVVGDFTITLDPTLAVMDSTDGITLNSLNIALGSPLSYTYSPMADSGFPPGTLRVRGVASGSDVIIFTPSTNDFWLFIEDFPGRPAFEQLGYTQTSVSSDNLFFTLDQTGSVVATVVPEPASITALSLGLVWLGVSCRFRKQSSVASCIALLPIPIPTAALPTPGHTILPV